MCDLTLKGISEEVTLLKFNSSYPLSISLCVVSICERAEVVGGKHRPNWPWPYAAGVLAPSYASSLTAMDTSRSGFLICITSVRSYAPRVMCLYTVSNRTRARGGGTICLLTSPGTLLSGNYAQSVFCLF